MITLSRTHASGASPLNPDSARERSDDVPDRRSDARDDITPGRVDTGHEQAREKFGGVNLGAVFFGWIVAIGVAVLLTSVLGAVGAGLGFSGNVSQSQAERQAGTIGVAAAIVLTLLAALVGGKVGHRYHDRVDRVAGR
ncbi:MAG: hypothetical protein JWR90_988 [Marmoricola sp.]|nr:hypothetical protein [Marmoricola sp.]